MTPICELSDVPFGEMRCFTYEGRRYLIAHTESGVFASDEMCTHEDASLCDGNLTGHLVKCPLHGSRFDLTSGKVLDDPADTDLAVYKVNVVDGKIYFQA